MLLALHSTPRHACMLRLERLSRLSSGVCAVLSVRGSRFVRGFVGVLCVLRCVTVVALMIYGCTHSGSLGGCGTLKSDNLLGQ